MLLQWNPQRQAKERSWNNCQENIRVEDNKCKRNRYQMIDEWCHRRSQNMRNLQEKNFVCVCVYHQTTILINFKIILNGSLKQLSLEELLFSNQISITISKLTCFSSSSKPPTWERASTAANNAIKPCGIVQTIAFPTLESSNNKQIKMHLLSVKDSRTRENQHQGFGHGKMMQNPETPLPIQWAYGSQMKC